MLDQALAYLDRGLSVFPVCTPVIGTNRCLHHAGCSSPGKVALVKWKPYQDERASPETVRSWWGRWQGANIAMATGPISGVDVIDLDGDLATREAINKGIEIGPWAYTGRVGGRHIWCRHRDDAPHNFAKVGGIDFRGYGGYVLLPPSLHYSGTRYRWATEPTGETLPELPGWINELANEHRGATTRDGLAQSATAGLDVDFLVENGVPEGQRDDTLFRLAAKLRGMGIPYDLAIDLVERSAERCLPPFPLDQARAKVDSAYRRYEPNPESSKPVRLQSTTGLATIPGSWARPISALLEQAESDPDWLVDNLFSVGSSGFIAAEPKVGKSFISLELAYCMSTGDPFLDRFLIKQPRRVLFIEEEDSERRMVRRFKQLIRGTPGRPAPDDEMFRFVCRSGFRLDDPDWLGKLRDELRGFQAEVVFLDVFNKLHLKDENSQPDMSAILHDLAALTREFGCAFIIIHHYRKSGIGQSARGNQMLRGHSSLAGFAECSLFLKKGQGNKIVCEAESKDVAEVEPFDIQIKDVEAGVKLVSSVTTSRVKEIEDEDSALAAIDALTSDGKDVEALSVAEITTWDRSKASRTLNRLVAAGKLDVETVKRGRAKFRFYSRVNDGNA